MTAFRQCRGGIAFVQTCRKLKNIRVGGLEYNYFNLESYIVRQCAPSLKAFILANGGDVGKLLDIINKAQLSKKHEEMLAQLKIGGFDI